MSSLNIAGDTSGVIALTAPAVAGNNNITLQAATATMGINTLGTSVPYTSFTTTTYHEFTNVPSWAKRITVLFSGISTSGTNNYLVQIGTGGVTAITGYASTSQQGATSATATSGFIASQGVAAARVVYGSMQIYLVSPYVYVASSILSDYTAAAHIGGGGINLGGVIDRVRVTTVNTVDTFDAGSVNILYEG